MLRLTAGIRHPMILSTPHSACPQISQNQNSMKALKTTGDIHINSWLWPWRLWWLHEKSPPQDPPWSPVGGAVCRGYRTFRRWSLVRGSVPLGPGFDELWPWPTTQFLFSLSFLSATWSASCLCCQPFLPDVSHSLPRMASILLQLWANITFS